MRFRGDRNRRRAEFTDGHRVSPSWFRGFSFVACRACVGLPEFLPPRGGALPFQAGRTGRSYASTGLLADVCAQQFLRGVTGANICRMISRCFSQNGAEPVHVLITCWSVCTCRSIPIAASGRVYLGAEIFLWVDWASGSGFRASATSKSSDSRDAVLGML
jgi:hypothetical protein